MVWCGAILPPGHRHYTLVVKRRGTAFGTKHMNMTWVRSHLQIPSQVGRSQVHRGVAKESHYFVFALISDSVIEMIQT